MSQPDRATTRAEASLEQWWERYSEKRETADEVSVTMYLRSFAPKPGRHDQRAKLTRGLRAAQRQEKITTCERTVLSEKICLCEQCQPANERLLQRVEALRTWRTGGVRTSGFVTRNVRSAVTEEEYTLLVPPEITFGIYAESELIGAFPCVADGVQYGPETFLAGVLPDWAHESSETVHRRDR